MSIINKRNTGWIGSFTKIQIKLNGEKFTSVTKNQQIEFELSNHKATIKAILLIHINILKSTQGNLERMKCY